MPVVSSYHYVLGPLVALGALVACMVLSRWVFSTSHRDERLARRVARLASAGDYGLLVPVSTVRTRDDAIMLRDLLHGAGIRANTSEGELPGEHLVLVFRADAARAKQLV